MDSRRGMYARKVSGTMVETRGTVLLPMPPQLKVTITLASFLWYPMPASTRATAYRNDLVCISEKADSQIMFYILCICRLFQNMQALYQLAGAPGQTFQGQALSLGLVPGGVTPAFLQQLQAAQHSQLVAVSAANIQAQHGMVMASGSGMVNNPLEANDKHKDDQQAEYDLQLQIQQQLAAGIGPQMPTAPQVVASAASQPDPSTSCELDSEFDISLYLLKYLSIVIIMELIFVLRWTRYRVLKSIYFKISTLETNFLACTAHAWRCGQPLSTNNFVVASCNVIDLPPRGRFVFSWCSLLIDVLLEYS
uniref:GRF1-interacting factor 1 n=1 Tax=Heterorhabditis bacteriophora TaxID=37862 RepID=A0A1I7W892_HETBA